LIRSLDGFQRFLFEILYFTPCQSGTASAHQANDFYFIFILFFCFYMISNNGL
jgi:hypothetical protein